MDKEGLREERLAYVQYIAGSLKKSWSTLIPTPPEERSFEEALTHVVRVVSSNGLNPTDQGTFSCNSSSSGRTSDRKLRLKKIFDQLCWMERNRLYDPPGIDEIGHYLLIKKYIRAIVAFNLAAARDHAYHRGHFGCSSLYYSLHSAEEILELNRQLEELSELFLGKDIDDGFTLAPLMCMKESNEMVSALSGSNERSYMFYCHKFLLASIDLKNSEFSCCPPFEDEKRSYVHVLDNVAAPLIKAQDQHNVYSEELYQLYLERIYHEMVDIERHLANIRGWILKKLSLTDWWELMAEQIQAIEYDECGEYEDHYFVEHTKELTEKCEVSNEDLPNYISQIDRCLTIALLVVVFILDRTEDSDKLGILKTVRTLKQTGWEIVHALSLLKHGPFVRSTFQGQHILQMPQTCVPVENHQVERKHKHILEGKGQDENVVILEEIIDNLKCIGDSDIVLDQEEIILARRIWRSVASSTHFFVGAMTYEQRRHMMQHVGVLDLPRVDTKETIPLVTLETKQISMEDEMINLARILEAYKVGLLGKLKN